MSAAILVIDMLNDFFTDQRLMQSRKTLCDKINDLIVWGRNNKLKIIWVRQEFKEDLSDAFPDMKKNKFTKPLRKQKGHNYFMS